MPCSRLGRMIASPVPEAQTGCASGPPTAQELCMSSAGRHFASTRAHPESNNCAVCRANVCAQQRGVACLSAIGGRYLGRTRPTRRRSVAIQHLRFWGKAAAGAWMPVVHGPDSPPHAAQRTHTAAHSARTRSVPDRRARTAFLPCTRSTAHRHASRITDACRARTLRSVAARGDTRGRQDTLVRCLVRGPHQRRGTAYAGHSMWYITNRRRHPFFEEGCRVWGIHIPVIAALVRTEHNPRGVT